MWNLLKVLHICLHVCTCIFPYRKCVFAGHRSAQGPVGVWSLHIYKVRLMALKPTVTFLLASVVMLITDWISAGADVLVKGPVT